MRIWAALTAVLLLIALTLFGIMAVTVGFAEQNAANHTYRVGFGRPGSDCGSGAQDFDVTTGDPLQCGPPGGIAISPQADFPGFTDGQNAQVQALAAQLGAGGLVVPEQRVIQHLVDQLAATVPASRRPHYDEGVSMGPLWGTRLIVAGAAALTIVVVSCLAYQLRKRLRAPSAAR